MKSKSVINPFLVLLTGRSRGEVRWREGKRIVPDVWDVIKLSDYIMPVIRTRETVFTQYLWAEVSKNQHSWVVLTHEN